MKDIGSFPGRSVLSDLKEFGFCKKNITKRTFMFFSFSFVFMSEFEGING